jgi:exodeoxyribonuclease VII small subunit
MSESQTYKAMLEELETIVRDAGSPSLDLDELVNKVEHGYALIRRMRERLDQTRERIEKLRAD